MTLPKSVLCMLSLGMALLVATSVAQESKPAEKAPQESAVANPQQEPPPSKTVEQAAPVFKSRREMLSYAFGVELARGLKAQRVNPDVDLMVQAFRDTLAGNKLLMSETEATAALKTYEEDQKHDFEHAKQMISEKNKRAGEALFAENVKKEGVVTLPSGLQYKILKQGDGKKPSLEDKVVWHYRGTLLDGNEFDSSYKRNQPPTLPVKGLIKGWSEALQLMPVGSKWQLFIPPQLAYGDRVVGGIGPNAMLVFEVELISIENTGPVGTQPMETGGKKDATTAAVRQQ